MSQTLEQTSSKAKQAADREKAKCVPHFERGIANCSQLSRGMSLLMSDVLSERISTSVANSVCNAAGKMIKAVEMQQRFGKTVGSTGEKELKLLS